MPAGFCKAGNCVLGCQTFAGCPFRNTFDGYCSADGVCYYYTNNCITSQYDLDGFQTNGCEVSRATGGRAPPPGYCLSHPSSHPASLHPPAQYNPTTSGTAVPGLVIYQHCGFNAKGNNPQGGWTITLSEGIFNLGTVRRLCGAGWMR